MPDGTSRLNSIISSAAAQHVTIPASLLGKGPATMTAYYHGTINDPPQGTPSFSVCDSE